MSDTESCMSDFHLGRRLVGLDLFGATEEHTTEAYSVQFFARRGATIRPLGVKVPQQI